MIGQESYTFHYQRNLQYGENKNGVSLGCIYQNNVGRKYIVLCIGDALKMSFKKALAEINSSTDCSAVEPELMYISYQQRWESHTKLL